MSITLRSRLFSLSFLAIAACGGHQGGSTHASSGGEEPVDKPATARPAQGSVAAASAQVPRPRKALSARPILDHLPNDRSIILHVSWRAIESSELFQQYRELFTKSIRTQVERVIDTCGFDPMTELESLTLALGADPQNNDDLIIAATVRIGRSQVEDCIVKTGGKIEENKYLVQGDSFHFLWANESTLLLAEKMSAVEMQAALAKGRAIHQESVMQFLRRTDSHAAIWGGGLVPSGFSGLAGSGLTMPHGFHLSLNVWSGIDAALGLSFDSEADASSTSSMLQMGINMMGSQLPAGADLSNAIQLQQVGNTISIDMVLAAQDVAKIIDLSK